MRPTSRPLSRTTGLLLATALTVLLAATACGSSDPTTDPQPPDPTSDTTVSATTPDTQSSGSADAYPGFWDGLARCNDPPNPDDPDLAEVPRAPTLQPPSAHSSKSPSKQATAAGV